MLVRSAGLENATKGLCEFGDKYYALVLRRAGHAVPATRSVQWPPHQQSHASQLRGRLCGPARLGHVCGI